VRQPEDLCLLLPADLRSAPIKVEVDLDVMEIVESMSGAVQFPIGCECLHIEKELSGPSSSLEAKIEATSDDGIETPDFTMQSSDAEYHEDSDRAVGADGSEAPADHPSAQSSVLGFDVYGASIVPSRVLLRAAINACIANFSNVMLARFPQHDLMRACHVDQTLLIRLLLLRKSKKDIRSVPSEPLSDDDQLIIGGGLLNIANDCYINAFVQIVFHILPFRLLIMRWNTSERIVLQLQLVFRELARKNLISARFLRDVSEPGRAGPKDCSEFGRNLLNALFVIASPELTEQLNTLIRFQIRHVRSYPDHDQIILDNPATMLIVNTLGVNSLIQALRRDFAGARPLGGVDVRGEKNCIRSLPVFLLIDVRRDVWINGRMEKDCHRFAFPTVLDMAPYAYPPKQKLGFLLAGVVAHLGLPHAGICHYVTFRRMFGKWICFNDSSVTAVDQEQAVDNNYPNIYSSSQTASLLLYVDMDRARG
jgi:hypothetical protein